METKQYTTHAYNGGIRNTVCNECILNQDSCGHKPDSQYSCKYAYVPVREGEK